jgi:hypothetical protein
VKPIRLAVKGLKIVARRLRRQGLRVTFTWAWTRLYLWTVGRPVLRYCPVTPQLYVGGQINARGWRWLAARDLSADVNMRSEFDDASLGPALTLSRGPSKGAGRSTCTAPAGWGAPRPWPPPI